MVKRFTTISSPTRPIGTYPEFLPLTLMATADKNQLTALLSACSVMPVLLLVRMVERTAGLVFRHCPTFPPRKSHSL